MMKPSPKILALPLLAGALCFTACGEKSDATEGAAASSDEINIPDAPDAALQFVLSEIAEGKGGVLWEAMPASYQDEVNAIAQLAGSKIDAEIYDKAFSTIKRVASVLDKQKEFVFNTSLVGEAPDEEEIAKVRASWPSVMDLVNALTTSSISSAAGLQSFKGEAFFKDTVSAVLTDMDALARLQPENEGPFLSDMKDAQVEYVEGTDSEATLNITIPGQETETKTVVKVEDRWVPQEMAASWEAQTTEARTKLEAIDPAQLTKQKPQIMSVFAMIEGVLTQIEAAESQQQFDQAVQSAMMPIMGLMMMGQGMGGGRAPDMPAAPEIPEMPSAPSAP
ncbi:hypothetical protein DDZ13_02895 [Coraliomargarita sinensis]|uniref:Uncharacterized protein n=1 Tax=Coraliomargarita sinensis TaxID=2174842 RepID=A0A317ZLX7_9BACT|nr:hypothetical protein [Coraliomargarita sinensis]PXA04928.1 hypothetical protein DDZ13_02895 [Coraliomargarita sinensis]